jgi:nucleoside-diphosphate-sugar epimerase
LAIETLLITGATGFVGSHVAEAVAGRVPRIRALVRSSSRRHHLEQLGIEPVLASLEDAGSVRRAVEGADVVVHMAAALRAGSEKEFARVNAQGTTAVAGAIRAAARPPRRLVYLSSLAAVGPVRDGRPVCATDEPRPLTAYGRTKLAGEQISAGLRPDREVVILRAPAVYGPRDRDVFEFFRIARWGVIPVPAGPPRMLQMIHAADLARAVALAATADSVNGVYHIAESRAYEWQEVGRLVGLAVGRNARPVRIPAGVLELAGGLTETVGRLIGKSGIFNRDKARELLAPGWLCETSAARVDLGFEAAVPLAEGLMQTADWYRAHGWL